MKNAWTNSLAALTIMALMPGCASIVHGPTQPVDFTSQPHGATITIDGREYGRTPKAVELRRKGRLRGEIGTKTEYDVQIELAGYHPYDIKLKREMDGWFLGNILFGGIIGIIIDASNGSMYKLTPDQVIAQMGRAVVMNTPDGDDKIYVAVTLKPDPSWEKVATLQTLQKVH